jgi:NAD(P)H-dependent flavin oxidoreductase YrpB (nitropropane dioxygenase family)
MAHRVSSKAWVKNSLTSRWGLQYPIIQGPLGGLSSQRLTSAVSHYGGSARSALTGGSVEVSVGNDVTTI